MPRLLPSIEVRPLAGALWYGLAIMIVIGIAFASGAGGALVWIAFWFLVALIAYVFFSRTWGRVT